MPIAAAALGLAAIVWGVIVARRTSLLAGVSVLLVLAYVFGHEFWNAKVGPLPLTLDRILLAGLLGVFAVQWRAGQVSLRRMTGADWLLVALIGLFSISALLSGSPEVTDDVTSKWGRLVTSFAIPAILYVLVRQIPITQREWSRVLVALVALGVYLSLTAVLEVAGLWSLVFPRYISNPELGIHFGRARGPELNSVSLGLYLTIGCLCAWFLLPQARQRWQQLALLICLPLMAGGVLLTYTRSTWIGLAASGFVVAAFQIPRRLRVPAVVGTALVGLLLICISWNHLLDIQREGATGDSEHSVDQRASFAYVSWQMFCDHPILGVGFGRFYDQKLPYLSDRRQSVELESIRGLHHHNTFLSVLTETGIVGIGAFLAVLAAWARCAWKLAANVQLEPWVRAQGLLLLALLVNYLCSAVFHDLTLLPSQELILFAFAGLAVNLAQAACAHPSPASIRSTEITKNVVDIWRGAQSGQA
jgi:O-antigen ligase